MLTLGGAQSCRSWLQVYWMLERLCESWEGDLYAVFMSNVNRTVRTLPYFSCRALLPYFDTLVTTARLQVPIWCNARSNGPVIWDYHVLAVGLSPMGGAVIFDLDSSLPFPCPVGLWIEQALLPQSEACQIERLRRRWRCVEAGSFLSHFASDRSHMVKKIQEGGEVQLQWSSAPPPYNCISTDTAVNTLPMYMDMSGDVATEPVTLTACHGKPFGILLDESTFLNILQHDR